MAKPTKTSVSKTTKQGTKSAGTDWMPTSGKPIGLGSKSKTIKRNVSRKLRAKINRTNKDIARTEQDFISKQKKQVKKQQ